MLSPLPRRNRWVLGSLSFPSDSSLPHNRDGSASALPISRPAQRSIVTACKLAESLNDSLHRRLRRSRHLLRRYDCYRLERTLAGWDCLPLRNRAFTRRTPLLGVERQRSCDCREGGGSSGRGPTTALARCGAAFTARGAGRMRLESNDDTLATIVTSCQEPPYDDFNLASSGQRAEASTAAA